MKDKASSQGHFWELAFLNNTLGMMWDDEAPKDDAVSICKEIKRVAEEMDTANEISKENSDSVRQMLNNSGAYLLFQNNVLLMNCYEIGGGRRCRVEVLPPVV